MSRKWKITFTLFTVAALNYGDRTAISSVFPLLRADLHLSDTVLAAIGSTFLWAYALGSPIGGYLADRFSRRRMVLLSLIAWSVITLLTGFVHSAGALLFSRALLGLAECIYLPASYALIADHHGVETRGTAIGLQLAGLNVGLVGGSTLAGYIGEHVGWRMDFYVLGAAGLLLAVLTSLILRDAPRPQSSERGASGWRGVGVLLRIPGYIAIVISAMLIAVGTWIFLNWLPLYFHDRFHMSLAQAGLSSSSALQVSAILGAILGGILSDRVAAHWPRRRFLVVAICYLCASPFLLGFESKSTLSIITTAILGYSFLMNLGAAGEAPIICELASPQLRSTGLAILNTMNCLAGGIGIFGASFLSRERGWDAAFATVAGTVAAAGLVVLIAYLFWVRQRHSANLSPETVGVL